MLTTFEWICLLSILTATFAGGWYPLLHRKTEPGLLEFPLGEAFTAGVFIALALTLMLPSSSHLLGKAFAGLDYPLSSVVASVSFLGLLALEHRIDHLQQSFSDTVAAKMPFPAVIPVVMTIMIAVPSFFLGTALGVSTTEAAIFIFVAIIMHKSSAAFALALKMVRSTMTHKQAWLTFCLFALSTPTGIIVGEEIHNLLGSQIMVIVKGIILGMAAGTFLYMATIHEFQRAPLITKCNTRLGFATMLSGFVLTALVRFLIGEAHKL